MSDIDAIARKYERAFRDVESNIIFVMNDYGKQLLDDFRERSAVDTGRYQRSWRFQRAKRSGAGFSMTLKNPTKYAPVLVSGAEIGGAPWNFTGKRRSGKLFIGTPKGSLNWWPTGGRRAVWAGGRNPGKGSALGGIKGGLFSNGNFQKKFITNLAKVVVKGL